MLANPGIERFEFRRAQLVQSGRREFLAGHLFFQRGKAFFGVEDGGGPEAAGETEKSGEDSGHDFFHEARGRASVTFRMLIIRLYGLTRDARPGFGPRRVSAVPTKISKISPPFSFIARAIS